MAIIPTEVRNMLFSRICSGGIRSDDRGDGHFGASRKKSDGTPYAHEGLDLEAAPREVIFSPITGIVTREGNLVPRYEPWFRLVVIVGTGYWVGTQVKILYVEGWFSGPVNAGQPIGTAQNLWEHRGYAPDEDTRRNGITNHVHVEVRQGRRLLNPEPLFGSSLRR
jgi:hypothetical protein